MGSYNLVMHLIVNFDLMSLFAIILHGLLTSLFSEFVCKMCAVYHNSIIGLHRVAYKLESDFTFSCRIVILCNRFFEFSTVADSLQLALK